MGRVAWRKNQSWDYRRYPFPTVLKFAEKSVLQLEDPFHFPTWKG